MKKEAILQLNLQLPTSLHYYPEETRACDTVNELVIRRKLSSDFPSKIRRYDIKISLDGMLYGWYFEILFVWCYLDIQIPKHHYTKGLRFEFWSLNVDTSYKHFINIRQYTFEKI